MVDVDDIRAQTARLRDEGVQVGTIVEVAGQMLLVDVFDPDGNRIQLSQPL
jgi:predicted enzyme related to lactoylglutathione lyase